MSGQPQPEIDEGLKNDHCFPIVPSSQKQTHVPKFEHFMLDLQQPLLSLAPAIRSESSMDRLSHERVEVAGSELDALTVEPNVTHMNYPLILDCTARPLKDFKSSRELCTSIRDTVEAHGDVYMKTGILHRDVSAVNILIVDGGKGQLIDSDSCIRVTSETSRCHWKTGTWQFTAGQILRHPGTQHEFRHDLESFFHVLYYHVMRYCHNPSGTLASDILKVYDSCCWDSAHKSLYGGQEKICTFGGRYLDPQELYGQLTPSFVELLLDLDEHFLNTYIGKGSRSYNEASPFAPFTLLANSEGVLAIEPVRKFEAMRGRLEEGTWSTLGWASNLKKDVNLIQRRRYARLLPRSSIHSHWHL